MEPFRINNMSSRPIPIYTVCSIIIGQYIAKPPIAFTSVTVREVTFVDWCGHERSNRDFASQEQESNVKRVMTATYVYSCHIGGLMLLYLGMTRKQFKYHNSSVTTIMGCWHCTSMLYITAMSV